MSKILKWIIVNVDEDVKNWELLYFVGRGEVVNGRLGVLVGSWLKLNLTIFWFSLFIFTYIFNRNVFLDIVDIIFCSWVFLRGEGGWDRKGSRCFFGVLVTFCFFV